MTGEQYKRANKVIYVIIMLILLFVELLQVMDALAQHGASVAGIVQIVTAALCIGLSTVGRIKFLDKKIGSIMIVTGGSLTYMVIAFCSNRPWTFIYSVPMLILTILLMNVRLELISVVLVWIGNIIHMGRMIAAGSMTPETSVIQGGGIILIGLASYAITRLLAKFNEENMAQISADAKAREETMTQMVIVADNLTKHFESAQATVSHLKECINTNHDAMQDIADSTECTAESIQKQAIMCDDISQNTDFAKSSMDKMMSSSDETLQNVNEGTQLIAQLREQAILVKEASITTVKSTEQLNTKVAEVKDIISVILGISAQTNLLALNASIEAARAGEAGKGFAVVADEIRQLSEQTKDATNRITEIITELNEDAGNANTSVEDTITSIEKQNEMINVSGEKFAQIESDVKNLSNVVNDTEKNVKNIINSTNIISENIAQLSATSEEVAAGSNNGVTASMDAVEVMAELDKLLQAIYALAQDLSNFAK